MKEKTEVIIAILLIIIIVSVFVFIAINVTMSSEIRYTLIDGDDVISYEVIDGSTVNIITENETYEVELYKDVDFTVNSDIYIEIVNVYYRKFFWEEFEPGDNVYSLNRIIKTP